MRRCEYCKKDNSIMLIPVRVVSRSKQFQSLSHYKCLKRWRRIADVTVDHSRLTERQAEYLQERKKSESESKQNWWFLKKKPSLAGEDRTK